MEGKWYVWLEKHQKMAKKKHTSTGDSRTKTETCEYAERHYQSMSGVVCQALDLLYAREEQQNNKE